MPDILLACGIACAGVLLALIVPVVLSWLLVNAAEIANIVPLGTSDEIIASTIDPPDPEVAH